MMLRTRMPSSSPTPKEEEFALATRNAQVSLSIWPHYNPNYKLSFSLKITPLSHSLSTLLLFCHPFLSPKKNNNPIFLLHFFFQLHKIQILHYIFIFYIEFHVFLVFSSKFFFLCLLWQLVRKRA
ncbi:hypothetical protein RIF29_11476 [Crotalaria pallida]|uniref:Uncharacterized protein n=1 Tax=Crotalaria pallida TaxID=3830 RepID=A0AAN9IM65_CROPI